MRKRLLSRIAHSSLEARLIVAVAVLFCAGGGYAMYRLAHPSQANTAQTSFAQNNLATQNKPTSTAASTPAPTPADSWVKYSDPSTGYSWQFAVTNVQLITTPTSAHNIAIPSGEARLYIQVETESLTNGSADLPMQWWISYPGYDPTDMGGNSMCIPVTGHPGACWMQAEYTDDSDNQGGDNGVILNTDQTSQGSITGGGASEYAGTLVPASTNQQDILIGEGQQDSIIQVPQP